MLVGGVVHVVAGGHVEAGFDDGSVEVGEFRIDVGFNVLLVVRRVVPWSGGGDGVVGVEEARSIRL